MPDKFKIILLIITVIIAIFLSFFIGLIVGQKLAQKEKSSSITKTDKSLKPNETFEKDAVTKNDTKGSAVKSNTDDDGTDTEPKVSTPKAQNDLASTKKDNLKENQKKETGFSQNQYEANTIGKLLSTRKNVLENKSTTKSADNNGFSFQPVTLHSSSVLISKSSPTYTISSEEPVDQYLARQQMNKLLALGFAAYTVNVFNKNRSSYLTRIGQYDTRKEAEVAVRNLPNIYRGKLKILRISKQIDQNSNTSAKQNGS